MTNRAWVRWSVVLGFALGGFFDGILLHQILQWHHLLSLVSGVQTLRAQVLWDGYFHALMYVLASLALWRLWRARRQADDLPDQAFVGALLIGFGLWHIVDSVLSHWVLGIHRIRLDSANPLFWDLIWFGAFGLLPLSMGGLLLRKRFVGDRGHGATLSVALAGLVTAGVGALSLRPAEEQRFTTIVFAPWISPAEALNALISSGGRLMWTDRRMTTIVAELPQAARLKLYGHGALLVSGTGLPNGCLNWSRV